MEGIASYMRKGVRTVQRYERDLGLPIRRPAGAPTGSVIATKPEIDAWISASPLRKAFRIAYLAQDNTEIRKKLRQQLTELHQLQEQAVQLRLEMSTARKAPQASIHLAQERLGVPTADSPILPTKVLAFNPQRKVN